MMKKALLILNVLILLLLLAACADSSVRVTSYHADRHSMKQAADSVMRLSADLLASPVERYDTSAFKAAESNSAVAPVSSAEAASMYYMDVGKLFCDAGFTVIETDEMYDKPAGSKFETKLLADGKTVTDGMELPLESRISVIGHYPVTAYKTEITIDFEENWFLNKYDVIVKLNDANLGSIKHGAGKTFSYTLQPGRYDLLFTSVEDATVKGAASFAVSADTKVTYHITCYAKNIEVKETAYESSLKNSEVMMPFNSDHYLRKNYETVERELKALGFSNVTSKQTTDHFWNPSSTNSTVKILIGNETKFDYGKVFSKSSSITVFYHVSDFTFDQQTVSVTEKDTFEIPYSITSGDNADSLMFSIDDPDVLRRNIDGTFTALIPGTAKVTVSCGGNKSSTCTVEVAEIIVPVESLLFAAEEIDVIVGSYFTLDYTTYPEDANYTDLTAEVSDKRIEIAENNRYYANEAGDTEITLYQDDRMLGTCIVHASVVEIEELVLHETAKEIYIGDTLDIAFDILPETANCKGIAVKSSDPEVADIEFDERGASLVQVTGLAAGKTDIIVTIPNGTQYIIPVTVNEIIPTEIKITNSDPTARIEVGTPVSLNVSWEPDNTSVKELKWSSSNSKVIKVDASGNLETVGIGTAEITAAHHSGASGMISLNVEPTLVTQIEISSNLDPEKAFNKGNKCKVKVSVFPENATDKSVTYTSSDKSVLKVSDKGEVTAAGVGTATITATSKDGPSASVEITVSPLPQKFKITWSAKMISNDHVGNGWSKSFSVNNKSFASGSTLTLKPDDSFTVYLEIQQNDENPDWGYYQEEIEYSEDLCKNGYKINSYIIVEENGGRYRGHYAEWEFSITITPVK